MKALFRIIWLALWLGVAVGSSVLAKTGSDVVAVDPPAVEIRAVKDHSTASATFYVTPNQRLDSITFDASDLNDTTALPTTQPRIPAGQITFSTSNLQNPLPGRRHQVQVNISNITQAGEWAGEITLQWTGPVTGELSIPFTVIMETVPTLVVKSPAKIVVRDTRGAATEERSVTIEEGTGGSPATGLSLLPQDLLNQDQSEVLARAAIRARFEPAGDDRGTGQLPGGGKGYAIVSLGLDGVRSGHYAGELVLQSDNAADLPIPIEVDVKDPPWWPGIVMALGVIIGIVLTWYRSSVMPKDRVRVRIQILNGHLEEDQAFNDYCGRQKVKVETSLAKDYLRQDRPAEAGSGIERAEKVWDNWRLNRKALLETIAAAKHLLEKIDQAEGDPGQQLPGITAMQTQISVLLREQIPQYVDKPNDLWALVFQQNTGWEPVLERALAVCTNLDSLHRALQEATSKGEPLLDAGDLEQLNASLAQVEAQVKAITAVPSVSQLDPIQETLRGLHEKLTADSATAVEARDSYTAYCGQAARWLDDIEDEMGSSEEHIAKAIEMVRGVGIAHAEDQARSGHWKNARRLAQNSLRATRACFFAHLSAQKYRQGQSGGDWDAVIQAETALVNWLTDSTHYDLDTEMFFNKLVELAANLRATVEKASGQTFPLDWRPLPTITSKGLDEVARRVLAILVERVGLEVPYASPGEEKRPARPRFWEGAWWTPRRRLWAANISTFVIGVGLLVFAGFKELYVDMPTFGVGGGWDYFKLFVWGFGAEAGRAQVVGLVKGWDILTPRSD